MTRLPGRILLLVLLSTLSFTVGAQRLALKTNAIDWLTMNGQIGFEARLSRCLSLDIGLAGNPFKAKVAGVRLNTLRFQPELRYWFNRPMARHFVGFSVMAANYDLELRSRKYEGDLLAAGFSYGYALVLSSHWNVEFEAGIGLGRLRAFKYREWEERPETPNVNRWMPVPMKIAVTFSYIFKPSTKNKYTYERP